MNTILIQVLLNNNREYSIFNQNLFKSSISNILQSKFYITHRRVNKVYYIDILYSKDSRVEIHKESIINIIKSIFTSVQRVYISIIERPVYN